MSKERRYTAKEIAFLEDVSESTVYGWRAMGYLRGHKRPGRRGAVYFTEEQYQEFKDACKARGETE